MSQPNEIRNLWFELKQQLNLVSLLYVIYVTSKVQNVPLQCSDE